jgi:hypothetical protein
VTKHRMVRKKAQESVVFPIVFIFLPLLDFALPGEVFPINEQKFEKQEENLTPEVFACKTLSLADSSSAANGVQGRIIKGNTVVTFGRDSGAASVSGLANSSLTETRVRP